MTWFPIWGRLIPRTKRDNTWISETVSPVLHTHRHVFWSCCQEISVFGCCVSEAYWNLPRLYLTRPDYRNRNSASVCVSRKCRIRSGYSPRSTFWSGFCPACWILRDFSVWRRMCQHWQNNRRADTWAFLPLFIFVSFLFSPSFPGVFLLPLFIFPHTGWPKRNFDGSVAVVILSTYRVQVI